MKKILALIITVMMLASTLVTGISAARVASYTPANGEPIALTEKYINATGGSPHMMDDSIANDDYTFRLVIKTPSNYYDEAKLGEFVRWVYDGPQFDMTAGKIGYAGKTLDYTFAYDTLYTIDWVVDGDTTIYVNGTEVGTLGGAMKAQMYGAFYRTMVKELSFIKDGEIIDGVKAEDFADGATVAYLGDAEVVTLTGERPAVASIDLGGAAAKWEFDAMLGANTTAMVSNGGADPVFAVDTRKSETVTTATNYAKCDANGHFQENALRNDDFTLEVTFKTPSDVYDELGELTMWYGKSATFNMKNGTISYGGASGSVNYTFAMDTEYTIKWVVDGDTAIYVNDEYVGTLSGAMGAQIYGAFYRCYVKDISFTEDGEEFDGVHLANFNDGDVCGYLADAEVVVETKTTTVKSYIPYEPEVKNNKNVYDYHEDAQYDGKALYFCNQDGDCDWPDGSTADGSAYIYTQSGIIPSDKVGACVLSFDMCPLAENAEFRNYFGWLVFSQENHTFDTLPCNFEVGTWHHIDVYCFYGSVGSVLYIDGQLAGGSAVITQVPGTQWCGGAINVALDNIAVYESGGANGVKGELIYLEDFDDGVWQKKDSDGGGRILDKLVSPEVNEHKEFDLGEYYYTWDDAKATVTEKYINATGGSPHMMDDSIANDDYTFRLVIKTPSNYYDEAKLGEFVRWVYDGPQFDMTAGKIGYAGKTLDYTFAYDTLYTIDWVVDGDTTIYVNGTEVGTLGGAMKAQMYGAFYRTMVKELSFIKDGEIIDGVKAEDFADGATVAYLGDAEVVTLTGERPAVASIDLGGAAAKWEFDAMLGANTTAMVSNGGADPVFAVDTRKSETVTTATNYAKCDANGHFQENALRNDDFTLEVTFKTPSDVYDELGELTMWYGKSATFNMKNGTISYGGASGSVNYTFAMDTEYTIKWVVDGDTAIYVNDEYVGTLSGAMGAQIYGAFYRCYVKDISFTEDGEEFDGVHLANFNDGDVCGYLADAEVVVETKTETVNSGSNGYVGVGETTLPYAFAAGEWYHIVLDGTVANGTDVYVDGALVGNVATKVTAAWDVFPCFLSIDNLKINDYFEDFEDDAELKLGDGRVVAYSFEGAPEPVEPEPEYDIFHWIETEEPGGTAYRVQSGYNYELGNKGAVNVSTYFDMESIASNARDYVINLDLALIGETDTTGDTYFEIWSNVASDRWSIGDKAVGFRGGDNSEDLVAFEWGELSKDNFHNVTWVFDKNTVTMYADGELVYGPRATSNVWRNMMIGNVYNGTAIIDNVQLFTFTRSNAEQPNELEAKDVDLSREEDVKAINLDAENFCAANGHIQYSTSRTTEPFCTTNGTDTTICAVCGETAKTTVVPALGHNWPNYYNGVEKDGTTWTWKCKRCGEAVSTEIPNADPLVGTIAFFLDFENATVVQEVADIFNADGEVVADGVGHFEEYCGQNYNQFDIPSSLRNQYKVEFDFNVKGLFDDDGSNSYGHGVWFWVGGDSGIGNEIGYDFDNNVFFARPWNSSAYTPVTVAYELSQNEWHHLEFVVNALGEDADENYAKIFVDGEEVLSFDDWFDTAYYLPTPQSFCIIRDFGVTADIDNFLIGSYDLNYTAELADINGDGKINTKDLKLMKLAIASVIEFNEIQSICADLNRDGKVNTQDLAKLKRVLLGEEL